MSNNTPRAGELRHRVELQSFSGTRDTFGEKDAFSQANWTTYATVWAHVEPMTGSEGKEGEQVSPETTHSVKVRYRDGIIPTHRVLFRKAHTTLGAAIATTNTTSVTVSDSIAMPERSSFMIKCESELMEVTAGHGTTALTATRGANNTTAATHAISTDVHLLGILGIEGVSDPDNARECLLLSCKETS